MRENVFNQIDVVAWLVTSQTGPMWSSFIHFYRARERVSKRKFLAFSNQFYSFSTSRSIDFPTECDKFSTSLAFQVQRQAKKK